MAGFKGFLDAFERFLGRLSKWFNGCAGAALVAMMIMVNANVMVRPLGKPLWGAFGIVGFLGSIVLSFALLQTTFNRSHMAVEVVTSRLPAGLRAGLDLFNRLVGILIMGLVAFQVGMSQRLFATAYTWLGHLPCGLAMASVGGCAGFSAISGSSSATAATMATVALPEMRKYRYDLSLATGSIAAGGTLGILIPPSVVLIIYGIQTEQSIGKLFVAGILPGILLSVLFMITILILSWKNPELGPRGPRTTLREKFRSLPGALEAFILFVLVMWGLLAGWFTPTTVEGITLLTADAQLAKYPGPAQRV